MSTPRWEDTPEGQEYIRYHAQAFRYFAAGCVGIAICEAGEETNGWISVWMLVLALVLVLGASWLDRSGAE